MIVDPATTKVTHRDGVETLLLSDAGGLRQFGCHIETLPPGTWSSQRHWHSAEDEFLYIPVSYTHLTLPTSDLV